jgi:hypothetical protein
MSSRRHVLSSDCSSLAKMDPFIHPFALANIQQPHTKWRGPALVRDALKTLRKQLHRNKGDDVREHLHRKTHWREEHKENQRIKIPSIVKVSTNPTDTSSNRRPSFHESRSLSKTRPTGWHRRQLSSIPESDDQDESAEDSSPSPSFQTAEYQPPLEASLLGLPTELRLQIYGYVFSDWEETTSLPLLSTCHQIHSEAVDLAFSKTLFRIHSEHWADHDYFQARYVSLLPPARLSSIRHLAVRLPRGAPYDCYNSRHLGVNLASLGLQLKTLVIFSHYPRPLPRNSDYGGVLEMSLCLWLRDALYSMRSLSAIHIVNYESATPGLFDIPSPRLVRLLRGEIFKDVMSERHSLSEEEFEWSCQDSDSTGNEQNRAYRVFSSKLGRKVDIIFEDGEKLSAYGLGHVREFEHMLVPDDVLQGGAVHPDLSRGAYAGLLARKNSRREGAVANSSRRRLGRSPSRRTKVSQQENQGSFDLTPTCAGRVGGSHFSPPGSPEPGKQRRRLSKRVSLPPTTVAAPASVDVEEVVENKSNMQKRRSWHPLSRAPLEKKQNVVTTSV